MGKKKKVVQVAEKQKSEASELETPVPRVPEFQVSKPAAALAEAVSKQPQLIAEAAKPEPKPSAPSITDILQSTDPKMLQTAQQLGIPLKPLMEWAINMEAIVKAQSEALEMLGVKLAPLISLAERAQQAQAQAQASPNAAAPKGGFDISSILQMLPNLLGGGGTSSVLQEKMEKFMGATLDKALQGINQPSKFEQYFDEAFAKKKAEALAKMVTEG